MTNHPSQVLRGLRFDAPRALGSKRAAFLGCGDSLASARPAESFGHRVMSAGDVAWSGEAPAGVDCAVALSWSGRTGATIRAAEVVKNAGMELIAVTANANSPLADLADEVVTLPSVTHREVIPALGYVIHSAAIHYMCAGEELDLDALAGQWLQAQAHVATIVERAPQLPQGVTVVSMPDVHGVGEFWMLKLIEATGLSVRWTPVEEVGHVDYFIGPQAHVNYLISGRKDWARLESLGAALATNGHAIVHIPLGDVSSLDGWALTVLGGALGADISRETALRWSRPVFRGGQVDLSAAHIQIPST